MNCFLRYIGVVDTDNQLHHVPFERGLNIVTGASSTGKSAILEIFDFCLGASENTIPVGRITERAKIYLIALEFPSHLLVAARTSSDGGCYLTEWPGTHQALLEALQETPERFTEERHQYPEPRFKKELGRYFNITLKNVDEEAWRLNVPGAKSPTPSIRTFASFMLQHQNLVANKHAVFYRFDEKEKREQAIAHFKILMGLVHEDYFDKVKELNIAEDALKKIQNQIPREAKKKTEVVEHYQHLLDTYEALAGHPLTNATADELYAKPQKYLEEISQRAVRINFQSDSIEAKRQVHEDAAAVILPKKRAATRQLAQVRESIISAKSLTKAMRADGTPKSIQISHTHCPMCDSHTDLPAVAAGKLFDAITWLNGELNLSSYAVESYADEERALIKEIGKFNDALAKIQAAIDPLDAELEKLTTTKNPNEQAISVKVELEIRLRNQKLKSGISLSEQELKLRAEVKELKRLIKAYDVETKVAALSEKIDAALARYGDRFNFEETYTPCKLKFDLTTFELWYQQSDEKRVYLRSMGSGANWLYSHLALFMALHYQFARHDDQDCRIPPILFLDQPTQVYFPALDKHKAFEATKASEAANRSDKKDADLVAVNNMFSQLAAFCVETEAETGLMPQVIVSDHADNLDLEDPYDFNSFVRRRWRDRGFIAEQPSPPVGDSEGEVSQDTQ